jgi:5-hydroxyisourate hydrolase
MSTISTHVLDTSLGKPAAGIRVTLSRDGKVIGSSVTDNDGRVKDLLGAGMQLTSGSHSLTFDVADYLATKHGGGFYKKIVIDFEVGSDSEHYHVPLLLNAFGYSTYRGS